MLQTRNYVLPLDPDNNPGWVMLAQNEDGRDLVFTLSGNGTVNIPEGSTAVISGKKPDGTVYTATCAYADMKVTVPETLQMTAVPGEWQAVIRILYNGETIASARIRFSVDADPTGGDLPSDSQLDGAVAEAKYYAETARSAAYGSPLTAATAADMIDTTRVYVYTGNEAGMGNGHWYYWEDGSWKYGGIYNAAAVQTDPTLSIPGMAADAAATGKAIAAEKAAREQADADLKSDFNSFVDDNFEFGSFTKSSSIFTAKPQYNASSAGWVPNTGYNSWYFLTDKDTEIYVDSTAVSAMYYFSIVVYNGEVSSANYVNRYRLSDNNLPTKSSPLTVGSGKTIVITIEYRDTDFALYASNAPLLLGNGFMTQVDENTNDAVDAFVNKNFAYGYLTKDSDIFTSKPQYSASSAGWVSNTGYNSWYFEADSDCIIYTEANNLTHYSICIYNGSVSSANYVARYRKSENNLPTKDAPLSVQSGQTIVVTIEYTDNDFSLFYNLAPVLLGDQMIKQVEDVIGGKTEVEYATNQYVITSNGITFDLRKTTNATINQDCWRFVSIKKNGTDIVNGDIIGVLIENGETDFMGGVHGDEEVVDFHIRADGKPITDAVTVCNKVTIFMYSHLYRVSSPTTNVIDRYVNITIENGVMTVENTFKCLVDGFVVQYAYNGGLIGIFKNNITYLASNTGVADLANMPSEWNNSHGNYWYDVLFADGLLHIENIVGKEQQNYSGRVQYFSSETPQRLKVYMTTDAGSTWNTGHICNGKFVYSFK